MSYASLNEQKAGKSLGYPICSKFCSLGFITSYNWNQSYLSVSNGFVRLYDSEETFKNQPTNIVQELYLDETTCTSNIKSKDYSRVDGKAIIIHYFYIQVDNGFWMPTR